MDAKNTWTDLSGNVDAGPMTGKHGTGHDDAVKAEKISTKTNRDWDTTNVPADGPTFGTEHDDSNVRGKGKEVLHAHAKEPE